MAEQQRDVIEVLEHDHREVEEMFKELEQLRGASSEEDVERRKELTDDVTIELVRHSVAEEVLVYPQVEDKVSAEEADHAREEHAEAEETLHRPHPNVPNEPLPRMAAGSGCIAVRPHARPRYRPRPRGLTRDGYRFYAASA